MNLFSIKFVFNNSRYIFRVGTSARTSYQSALRQISPGPIKILRKYTFGHDFITNFKTWLAAVKLFEVPSKNVMPNPNEFINSASLSSLVDRLNVPNDRFSVVPIEPNLNLTFAMEKTGTESVATAIRKINRNFDIFRVKLELTTLTLEMSLRQIVVDGLFAKAPADVEMNLDLIRTRVKVYERLVEGVVRSIQEGSGLASQKLATQVIKAWIMVVQMVEKDAWKNESVRYGVLALPQGITLDQSDNCPVDTPEPVKTAAANVGDKRPRSDSTSSNTLTASTGSSDDSTKSAILRIKPYSSKSSTKKKIKSFFNMLGK